MYYIGSIPCTEADIQHHGIKGQKWGIRRYQNPDGSLTPAGDERYEKLNEQLIKRHTFYSGRPDSQSKYEAESASRERGRNLARNNKKFQRDFASEMKRLDESEISRKLDQSTADYDKLLSERAAFNKKSGLYKAFNKRKGEELTRKFDQAEARRWNLGQSKTMVQMLATQELAKIHFSKKEYRDVEAYIAEMFDYQIMD